VTAPKRGVGGVCLFKRDYRQIALACLRRVGNLPITTSPPIELFRQFVGSLPDCPSLARNLSIESTKTLRRLAYGASDNGLLSPDLAASIRRVKGVNASA
jgi:hypothetical protein